MDPIISQSIEEEIALQEAQDRFKENYERVPSIQLGQPVPGTENFVYAKEEPGIYADVRPPTLYDRITDYLGLKQKHAKTTPLHLLAVETGRSVTDLRNEIFGTGTEMEVRAVIGRGLAGASGGLTDIIKKELEGEAPTPDTLLGTIAGAGAELAGFMFGPFKGAKLITGARFAPTGMGLANTARILAGHGANLGIASGLSSIIPSILESRTLGQAASEVMESMGMGALVGVLFGAFSKIESKPLRVAVGMAVLDKVRAGFGEWFTIDDVAKGVFEGTISKEELAQRSYEYLLDLYFLASSPSMKKQMEDAAVRNVFLKVAKDLNPDEIMQTIVSLRDTDEIISPERLGQIRALENEAFIRGIAQDDARADEILRTDVPRIKAKEVDTELMDIKGMPEGMKLPEEITIDPNREYTMETRQGEPIRIYDKETNLCVYAKATVLEVSPSSMFKMVMGMPDVVRMVKELMGKYPRVEVFRNPNLQGQFRFGKDKLEIAIKRGLFQNADVALRTLTHEFGHLADHLPELDVNQRGNILGRIVSLIKFHQEYFTGITASNTELREELIQWTHMVRPFDAVQDPEYTKYRYEGAELYADMMTGVLLDPQLLKRICPKTYEAFFDYMDQKPKFADLYSEIMDAINAGTIMDNRVKFVREEMRKGDKLLYDAILQDKGISDSLKWDLIDKHHYILSRIKKVGEKNIPPGLNPRYALEKFEHRISQNEVYMNRVVNRTIRTLEDAGIDWELFREYVMHKRNVEDLSNEQVWTTDDGVQIHVHREIANPFGWTQADSEKRIAEIKQMTPERLKAMEDAWNQFWKLRQDFVITPLRRMGILSEKLMDFIESNPYYATYAIQEYFDQHYGSNTGPAIYKRVGTLQAIVDPVTATMMKDISLMQMVNRITATRSIVEFMAKYYPLEVNRARISFDANKKVQVQHITSDVTKGTVFDMRGGKLFGYDLPKEIAESVQYRPHEMGGIARVMGYTMNVFRHVFTEDNFGFWMFNMVRDYVRAAKNLPGSTNIVSFLPAYLRAMKPAFRSAFGLEDKRVNDLLMRGDMISITDWRGYRASQEDLQVERLARKYGMDIQMQDREQGPFTKMFSVLRHVYENYSAIGKAIERIPKVAAEEFLKKNYPNMTQIERDHMIRNWAGSPDFLRKGEKFAVYNNLFMFSNAWKEGMRSDYEAMTKSPATFWFKMTQLVALPVMAMFAASVGFLGKDVKYMMDRVSEYDKTNYYVVPLGIDENDKAVYFRIPKDEVARVFGGILWKSLGQRWSLQRNNLLDYMSGQAPTLTPIAGITMNMGQYMAGGNPYDFFRQQSMIPDSVFKAHDSRTDWWFAKAMLNQAGTGIIYRFDTSDPSRVKGDVEKLLGYPIVSNILGRFLRVSDQGLREGIQRNVLDVVRTDRARQILDTQESVYKMMKNEPLTDKDLRALAIEGMRGSEVMNHAIMNAMSHRFGNVFMEYFMTAGSNDERVALLKYWVEQERRSKK